MRDNKKMHGSRRINSMNKRKTYELIFIMPFSFVTGFWGFGEIGRAHV